MQKTIAGSISADAGWYNNDPFNGQGNVAAGDRVMIGRFGSVSPSATRVFTFSEFVELATKRDSNPSSEGRPYLGIDVFKRSVKQDVAGHHGSIGQALLSEFTSAPLHATLTSLHSSGKLPLLSSIHLFIGMARINYHCHYDLNPNLHFQLVGRKRFILFPPEEWRNLYPFPVHHDLDRRSQLNLDNPTIEADHYPKWQASNANCEMTDTKNLYRKSWH